MKLVIRSLFAVCLSTLFSIVAVAAATPPTLDASIQTMLDKYRTKYRMVGIELSVKLPGDAVSRDYFSGSTALDGATPITKNSLFQIGSNTESFTAAVILQLEAEGKLSIDDPIGKWFPQYADWKAITVRQLLNHTSGVFDYATPTFISDIVSHPALNTFTLDELADMAYKHKPNMAFKTGKMSSYCSTDYVLAGLIIQSVTSHTFAEELNQRLLGNHIGLVNTFYIPYPDDAAARLARGYMEDASTDVTELKMDWAGPSGAMISNAHDVSLWIQNLFSGRVLQAKQLSEMTSLVSIKNAKPLVGTYVMGEGLGISSDFEKSSVSKYYGIVYEHGGGTLGYRSHFMYLPCFDTIVTLAANNVSKNKDEISIIMNDVIKSILKSPEWLTYKNGHSPEQLPDVCKKLWK